MKSALASSCSTGVWGHGRLSTRRTTWGAEVGVGAGDEVAAGAVTPGAGGVAVGVAGVAGAQLSASTNRP
ncbi:MAG: hypothetical protein QXZ09_07425 [Candidatus Methanomethylicaceae archaeon]